MSYIPTGFDRSLLMPQMHSGPAQVAQVRDCERWPSMTQRRAGTTVTMTGCEAYEANYVYDTTSSTKPFWRRRQKKDGPKVTVTWTDTPRSRCQKFGLKSPYDKFCADLLEDGKKWEEAVCGAYSWGTHGGVQAIGAKALRKKCEKIIRDGGSLAEATAHRPKAAVREHRASVLAEQCAAAGVPPEGIELCVAARQQGHDLETAAAAGMEQAGQVQAAAGKRRNMLLIGGGAALLVGLIYFKKKGKK